MKKFTILDFERCKRDREKITMVTAYDYTYAQIVEQAGVETILVGDSLGMTVLGYEDTLPVTMEDMIHHGKAVCRGAKLPFVVIDMPFMSYHIGVEQAVENAGRLIKETGANAVKLEGGKNVAPKIRAIVDAQIPVMGHIGLTPQSINALGGFKVQGKTLDVARKLLDDAKALETAGCFSIVIEGVPSELAAILTDALKIPTIGIGAGAGCDGQVLVLQDMLGLFQDLSPKFVKHYAELREVTVGALREYVSEVKASLFPAEEHCFKIGQDIISELKSEIADA